MPMDTLRLGSKDRRRDLTPVSTPRKPPSVQEPRSAVLSGRKEYISMSPVETPRPKRCRDFEMDCSPPGFVIPQRKVDWTSAPFPPVPSMSWKAGNQTPEVTHHRASTPPPGPLAQRERLDNDIHAAVQGKSLPLLSLALTRGLDCCDGHCTYEAVRRHHVPALAFLLESGVQDFDTPCCGRRPLHIAIQACTSDQDAGYKMSEILLQHGARPNPLPGDDPCTAIPLLDAAKRGCASAMILLLKYGADPNVCDVNGYSPMHIICRQLPFHGIDIHHKAVSLLLEKDADPAKIDLLGLKPIDYTSDATLKQKLWQAERRWERRPFLVALGRRARRADNSQAVLGGGRAASREPESAVPLPEVTSGPRTASDSIVPEVFDTILKFL